MISFKSILQRFFCFFPIRTSLGYAGKNSNIQFPSYVTTPKAIHMDENTVIRRRCTILNNKNENVYIKKYTVISTNCTIVTNNHISTVGIPQCLLGASHINDISRNITIGEDVFIGTNVTIMPSADIGRGAIIGAGSIVTKPVPPYALVAGIPAKIIGVKFNIEQILKHETILYPPDERMSESELKTLFAQYYVNLRTYGVDTTLSDEDKKNLNKAKLKRKFIEPNHRQINF